MGMIPIKTMGSGCGSVDRAVASNSRGPRFESSIRQKFKLNIYSQLYWKGENKGKKRPIMAHLKKTIKTLHFDVLGYFYGR